MRALKTTHHERVAGLFLLFSGLVFVGVIFAVAMHKGWFESKEQFFSVFQKADGITPGTPVQIMGIRVGTVDEVELTKDRKIKIVYSVRKTYMDRLKYDSEAQLIRPFIIGERVLDITVGSDDSKQIAKNSEIAAVESFDLLTLLSGRELNGAISQMGELVGNFQILMKAFLSKERTASYIRIIDRLDPLLKNANGLMTQLATLTQDSPDMIHDVRTLVTQLNVLTKEFQLLVPAIREVAPELPKTSKRAVEALDEAVVLMKALQKTFLIRSSASEVRAEEAIKPRD